MFIQTISTEITIESIDQTWNDDQNNLINEERLKENSKRFHSLTKNRNDVSALHFFRIGIGICVLDRMKKREIRSKHLSAITTTSELNLTNSIEFDLIQFQWRIVEREEVTFILDQKQ